jgi:peroxiredoxin
MPLSTCLLTSLLLGATPTAPADHAAVVKLDKGAEITWRGSFSEAIVRPNIRAFRAYEVETRAFVLDVTDGAADVAVFSLIKLKPDVKVTPEPPPISRLELLRIDSRGNVQTMPPDSLAVPFNKRKMSALPVMTLEGLPTIDAILFQPLPKGKLQAGQKWEVAEEKRPPLKCRLEGIETIKGARTWRIIGLQQTGDWEALKISDSAWRRGDSIWVSAQYGWTARAERFVEKRDPQSGEVGFRSKLLLEQVGRLTYPGRLGEDRREEIVAALHFLAEYERLAAEANRGGTETFDRLIRQIEQHTTTHFLGESLPYREPILWIKRKAEAAKRGQLPPVALPPETVETPVGLFVNRPAPDVTAVDLSSNQSMRLSKQRGRPVVLLYYQPGNAKTAEPVLRLAESLHVKHGTKAAIVPLAIGASDVALQQRNDLKLTVHVLGGRDVYRAHGIEATPSFVVIDATGVVKRLIGGWSDENAAAVQAELEKYLK